MSKMPVVTEEFAERVQNALGAEVDPKFLANLFAERNTNELYQFVQQRCIDLYRFHMADAGRRLRDWQEDGKSNQSVVVFDLGNLIKNMQELLFILGEIRRQVQGESEY